MEGSCTSLGKASTGLPLVVPLVQLVGEMAAMAVHSTGLAPTGLAPCCDPPYCPGRKRRNDLEPKKLHMQNTQMSNASFILIFVQPQLQRLHQSYMHFQPASFKGGPPLEEALF